MTCKQCGRENPSEASFCMQCGAKLEPGCARCGRSNPAEAVHCIGCGHSLTEVPSAPAHPAPPPLPSSFASGRYQVRRFTGEGAKKRVFEAHDTLLDRDVAVALIRTEGLDTLGRQRVTQEAQALGRLGAHPNIVSVFDLGDQDAQPFFVTELMAGDVARAMREADGPLPLERTLAIARDVCRGLEFAHEQHVVHRDLKPSNVCLTADGTAKIGDFGLAISLDRSRLTQQGMIVGTFAYMPPEQALGGDITSRSDLYALGAMLYEMVAGRPPFPGDDPTAVISQHINVVPVAPSWYTEHCPPDLEEIILRLLSKDPGQRPASAAEVLAVLERVDPTQGSASHSESNVLDRLARGVFVGREQEMDRLHRAFDEAFAGRGSLVMLVGEPGIGKTRAVQELETYARIRGGMALWGGAHEAAGAPAYWPWVQIGRMYGSTNDVTQLTPDMQGKQSILGSIFPERREDPNYAEPEALEDPEAAQFRLFDAYATFVRAMAKRSPLIIALDDLHWADKPTLLLLQHLARELSHMRVLLVGTYRDTDLVRGHPLSEALATLNRGAGFQRVVLRGLSQDEVAAYIRSVANVEPSRPVVERIFQETEGNPFFLSEVVNLMAQEGTLTLDSVSDIAVPDGVREALGRRLDRISEEANELLQVAAIIGREFTYDTLTALGERDENELLRLIEEGLEARVIEEMPQPGRYRFMHALMQETLLGELSTTRRVRLHGQVGEALERRWGSGPRLLFISGTGGDLRRKPSIFDGPLVEAFTILAYDQRGLGQTDVPDGRYAMVDYAEDANALLDEVGWARCNVYGVSFGGMVAQEFAIRFPERVQRLGLACTSSGGAGGASYPLHTLAALEPGERIKRSVFLNDTRRDAAWQAAHTEDFEALRQEAMARQEVGAGESNREVGLEKQLAARRQHDTYDRLPGLSMPVYICGGKYDGIAPAENLQALQRQIPNARLELFEGGHLFLREDGRARLRVIAFLRGELDADQAGGSTGT